MSQWKTMEALVVSERSVFFFFFFGGGLFLISVLICLPIKINSTLVLINGINRL